MRGVHSLEVLIWAVEHQFVIMCVISFKTLEAFNAIVKCSVCRVYLEWGVRFDNGSLPTSIVDVVINLEYVIS